MRLTILAIFLITNPLLTAQAADRDLYDNLRTRLKSEDKLPPRSIITEPDEDEEEDEEMGLSLQDFAEERKAICRVNPRAPECTEYGVLVQPTSVEEICARDPLGEKCLKLSDNRRERMLKRQAACRGGLKSRKCASARSQRRRESRY